MGTATGWRRNTCCDITKEEQEEDGCKWIGFISKRVAKEDKQGEVKKGADNLLLYPWLLWKHTDNEDGIFQSIFCLCKGWTRTRKWLLRRSKLLLSILGVQMNSGSHSAPYWERKIVLTGGGGFQLVFILRKSGVILPLPTYMLME